jgi:hypothetical protein
MRWDVSAALALVLAAPAFAQDKDPAPVPKPGAAASEPAKPDLTAVAQKRTTKLNGTFGGQRMNYAATIAETIIKAEDGTPKAAIVTTAYVKDRATQPAGDLPVQRRPRLGLGLAADGRFGPKRVAIPSDARDDGAPPYPILDNPDSLLDVTDLVFIDPPGTGFSHLIGKTEGKDSTALRPTPRRSPRSSAAGSATMAAGTVPSSSAAKATAPAARRRSSTSWKGRPTTMSGSTASSSSRRSSISAPAPTGRVMS